MVRFHAMELETVVNLCRNFETAGLPFWVDGGWGVDALLGEQTRTHSDLDLAVPLELKPQFDQLLFALGYQCIVRRGDPFWNWVMSHNDQGSVDLHGFVLNANGEGVLGQPEENSMYPAGALYGEGKLGDMHVKCIAPQFVLMFRNGFEPRQVDRHDVAALCERFCLERPSRFLSPDGEGS